MHTLRDVVERARSLPPHSAAPTDWPKALPPKAKLLVPGEGKLVLPGDLQGLKYVDGPGNAVAGLSGPQAREARALLLGHPALVIPLTAPTGQELRDLSVDPERFRSEKARALGLAVCVNLDDGTSIFGVSRLIALENGLRFGSTLLLLHDDRWTREVEAAEEMIIELLQQAVSGFHPRPEPNGRQWRKVVALLGGSDSSSSLPSSWKRDMRLMAGLREVDLDIRPNPESSRAEIVAELRTRPPTALLVWADWVANPHIFTAPFLSARPGARAELLGTADRSMGFGDHLAELAMHLREISPIPFMGDSGDSEDKVATWGEAATRIESLQGEHFVLTSRACGMLRGNPYPKPDRMLSHVTALAGLARAYFASGGNLGASLAAYAMENFQIEIALFDSSLSPPEIKIDGRKLAAIPHVKVDDYKDPANCGRIYFAIDKVKFRLVVDHIGLHNYG